MRYLPNSEAKFFKGAPRPYIQASNLGVIDNRIENLVHRMNRPALIQTIASCEGHGYFFVNISPYVSFKTSVEFAAAIAILVSKSFTDVSTSKLNYYWDMSAHFDEKFELIYVLSVPNIEKVYARRRKLDQDFELIGLMVEEAFNHFHINNLKVKGKPQNSN